MSEHTEEVPPQEPGIVFELQSVQIMARMIKAYASMAESLRVSFARQGQTDRQSAWAAEYHKAERLIAKLEEVQTRLIEPPF